MQIKEACALVTSDYLEKPVRPFQAEAVEALLGGNDCLILQATGSGKTWIAALLLLVLKHYRSISEITTKSNAHVLYIVSPLLAVIQDQMNALEALGVGLTGAALGSLDKGKRDGNESTRRFIEKGTVDVVWLTPEVVAKTSKDNHSSKSFLELMRTTACAIIIDEVHNLINTGDLWRPDYLCLESLRPMIPHVPIALMTASAPRHLMACMLSRLRIKPEVVKLIGCMDRPNVYYKVVERTRIQIDFAQVREDISANNFPFSRYPLWIYANNRNELSNIMEFILDGRSCPASVAKCTRMSAPTHKNKLINLLQTEPSPVKVTLCTGVLGNGMNPRDVAHIIHYLPPVSFCDYFQETGRAGRNGRPCQVTVYFSPADFEIKGRDSKVVKESKMRDVHIWEKYLGVRLVAERIGFTPVAVCRRQVFDKYFEGEPVPQNESCCDVCHPLLDVAEIEKYVPIPSSNVKPKHRRHACNMTQQEQLLLCEKLENTRELLLDGIAVPQRVILFAPQIVDDIVDDAKGVIGGKFQWPSNFRHEWACQLEECVSKFVKALGKAPVDKECQSIYTERETVPIVAELRLFVGTFDNLLGLSKAELAKMGKVQLRQLVVREG
ncbi:P-loop containing nucleoside triphosphate hydrolase protein [Obelidium mucronatum]|nr:P-loop containing nucleoside triphosphate hydrolase protein [Obelidium mucronatum]